MLIVLIRSIILYFAVLIALRIMGKGEIAEMNSYDLVITLLIAEVASLPMENNSLPILYGFASITGLVLMQTLISFLSLKSRKFAMFLSGKPSILIKKGEIDYKELKKERISIDELLEQLRVEGYFHIRDVQYAILETDGNLSILPSPNYNSTPTEEFNHLPVALIIDGRIISESLDSINKDKSWLLNKLKSKNISDISNIIVCLLDQNDKLFIQQKET